MGISITLDDVFKEVRESLDDLGGYDESMREKAMDLSKEIMGRLENDLSMVLVNYITEDYEDYLYEILGDEDQY